MFLILSLVNILKKSFAIPLSIFFQTSTLAPSDSLILYCENWYALECKRLKEGQAAGQEKEFSFIEALNESYFSDVIIKSSDGFEVSFWNEF